MASKGQQALSLLQFDPLLHFSFLWAFSGLPHSQWLASIIVLKDNP